MSRTYTRFGAETQLNWWGEWLVYLQPSGRHLLSSTEPTTTSPPSIAPKRIARDHRFIAPKSMGDAQTKFAPDADRSRQFGFSFSHGNVAMIFGGHMGDWYAYDVLGSGLGHPGACPNPSDVPTRGAAKSPRTRSGSRFEARRTEAGLPLSQAVGGRSRRAGNVSSQGKIGALKNMEAIDRRPAGRTNSTTSTITALFDAIESSGHACPAEKDFAKVMREMVMTEIYKLMFTGRGSETDVAVVLNTNQDKTSTSITRGCTTENRGLRHGDRKHKSSRADVPKGIQILSRVWRNRADRISCCFTSTRSSAR
ncbi:MAG: hypothetical protein MZU97_01180 [Bacillus subtilis]|nr:hypothetical protein [Bacillus subtilis]